MYTILLLASTILISILSNPSHAFRSTRSRAGNFPLPLRNSGGTTYLNAFLGEGTEDTEARRQDAIVSKFKNRVGNRLPRNVEDMEVFLTSVRNAALSAIAQNASLIQPIQELREIVQDDPVLRNNTQDMFTEAARLKDLTPLNTPAAECFEEFLHMLNLILKTSPAFYTKSATDQRAAGLIAFPINAILAFPMATNPGYAIFSNALVNQQLTKILNSWSVFLSSEESAYVLTETTHNALGAPLIPWLDESSKRQIVDVAFQFTGNPAPCGVSFEDVFVSNTREPDFGFKTWDQFFTKEFVDGIRPVGGTTQIWRDSDRVVLNACESAPFRVAKNVNLTDRFWIKQQPYSVENILDFDEKANDFAGGTIYQAFLSGLSYHRWHSPISGTVVKTKVVSGTYYLENFANGFGDGSNREPDTEGPNDSQPFISAVATRGLIFIKADGPIGLMCFCAIGMAEVSSIDINVTAGQYIHKGEEIGMFHYGGSSHCLLFRKGVDLDFSNIQEGKTYHTGEPGVNATNVPLKAQIARVVDDCP